MVTSPHWYGQGGQDRFVFNFLNKKHNGFFVDLAAHDPKKLSNTYTLEHDFGWKGVCIETLQDKVKALKNERSCEVVDDVVGAPKKWVVFREFTTSNKTETGYRWLAGLSQIVRGPPRPNLTPDHVCITHLRCYTTEELRRKGVKVTERGQHTVSLTNILKRAKAPKIMDYLSLDVEGSEFEVMRHFDFHSYRFRIMTIERPTASLQRLLTSKNYTMVPLKSSRLKATEWGETVWKHSEMNQTIQKK